MSNGCAEISTRLKYGDEEARMFCAIAISLGMIREEHAEKMLKHQQERRKGGMGNRLIGVILVEHGYMTDSEVMKVLVAQKKGST